MSLLIPWQNRKFNCTPILSYKHFARRARLAATIHFVRATTSPMPMGVSTIPMACVAGRDVGTSSTRPFPHGILVLTGPMRSARTRIHWRDLPYALSPGPEDGCWSGASLVEEDRVLAHYYGHPHGNTTALSRDPLLLNWEKIPELIPVPSADEGPASYRVYDPCIWKKDGVYYSLSGGTQPTGPGGRLRRANFLFRSPDLKHWEYLHPFVDDELFTELGDDGACPYFWPIGDKHILLFFSHMRGGRYLLGDYDKQRDKLVATDYGLFNFGSAWPGGVHAPSATPDGRGGLIAIFNVNWGLPLPGWTREERGIEHFGCWEGQQIMSLPRRLSLSEAGALQMEPAGDIAIVAGSPSGAHRLHITRQ